MDNNVLNILVCPICKGPLKISSNRTELFCYNDRLAFPIRDMVPVMLEDEARELTDEDL